MISEKTVELNVTDELLAWLRWLTRRPHIAVGPSLIQEGRFGFDAAYLGPPASALLIQYKRAHVSGNTWSWQLNRTQAQDQHEKLQQIEALGFPVFYAFPHFATLTDIIARRKRLLASTWWYPPRLINPPGGPKGHHEVNFDTATRRWWVTSAPSDLPHPFTVGEVADVITRVVSAGSNIESFLAALNDLFSFPQTVVDRLGPGRDDQLAGMSLLVSILE